MAVVRAHVTLEFFSLLNGAGVHSRVCVLLFLVLDDALRLFFVVVVFGAEASLLMHLATVLQMCATVLLFTWPSHAAGRLRSVSLFCFRLCCYLSKGGTEQVSYA
jgi:hypothetical protein